MSEYYQGPNNPAKLKVVTLVLPIIATIFVSWRISWRIWKKVIGLSDFLLVLGLSLSICLAGFNLDPYFRWGYGYHKADLPPDIQKALMPKISNSQPGFYTDENFSRAAKFLGWMANRIHTNDKYRNVGTLQVMNEPVHSGDYPNDAANMIKNFYPKAYDAIRKAESALGVSDANKLHIQYMGKAWGSADPTSSLPSKHKTLFDDHRYYKWDSSVQTTKKGYINAVCQDIREDGIIIGEWSISVADKVENNDVFSIKNRPDQVSWYKKYFTAQVHTFEKSGGWVFWSWKCDWINGYDEWLWCYKSAVAAGVIPKDAGSAAAQSPC